MPSTVIRAFDDDPSARLLCITFRSGRRYAYRDVPPSVVADLRAAFAKGVFFNRRLRDRYPCSELPRGDGGASGDAGGGE